MHELGQVYLCPYRSNGRTHTARVRAHSLAEADRKMRHIDWAPGCGPIGTPRPLPRSDNQASPASSRDTIAELVRRWLPV